MRMKKPIGFAIIVALGITMLWFTALPAVKADGPGDPYDWPVDPLSIYGSEPDTYIWEIQTPAGVTFQKWVFHERNWTELRPGNYSETLWFNVSQWDPLWEEWARIPFMGYAADEPCPIVSANFTWQYWDWTGTETYTWGYPYAFTGGSSINSLFCGIFIPVHDYYPVNWSWVNDSACISMGGLPADLTTEFDHVSQTSTKFLFHNSSQENWVQMYFNYTVLDTYPRQGALCIDFAQYNYDHTLSQRYLLRRAPGYTFDDVSPQSELPWGVQKGDKLIWNVTQGGISEFHKYEIAGFKNNASSREWLWATVFNWTAGTNSYDSFYELMNVYDQIPTELAQPVVAANFTWQYFQVPGTITSIWGYPYAFVDGHDVYSLNNVQVLPLQGIGGTVNMTWVNESYHLWLETLAGFMPADLTVEIHGCSLKVINTSASNLVVEQYNWTDQGVLRDYVMRMWEDGSVFQERHLLRGPGLSGNIPPAPQYTWGVQPADVIVWGMSTAGGPIMAYTKWEVLGFEDNVTDNPAAFGREFLKGFNSQWDGSMQKWNEASTDYYSTLPPDIPQNLIVANLTWQDFLFMGGMPMTGYPYAAAAGSNPQLNCLVLPLQNPGPDVNMTWFSTAYQNLIWLMSGGSMPPELNFAVSGRTFTITNTTSGVIREKWVFNAKGVLELLVMRNWDNAIQMQYDLIVGPGFPPSPAPPTTLTWGVSPGDEIVWEVGPDPEYSTDPNYQGKMKWNVGMFRTGDISYGGGFYRETMYVNATRWDATSGTWEYDPVPNYPPEVPQPYIFANTTWQYFQWNLGAGAPLYTWGYPYGLFGYITPFFHGPGPRTYNEFIVPLQSGVVNMSWVNQSWYIFMSALTGGTFPGDCQTSIVGNTWIVTNTTSSLQQWKLSYTSSGIMQSFYARNWDGTYLVKYTLKTAPGYVPDSTPPSIDILSPMPFQVLGNASPNFQVSISDPNLDQTWYRLNGNNYTFVGSSGTFNPTAWDAYGNGTVDITFYANDTYGHQSESTITVRKDRTPPVISINLPTTGTYSAPPSFDLSITEVNRDKIWYTLNDGVSNYTASDLTGTVSSTAWAAASAGTFYINFYVNDTGSNWANASVSVTKVGPSITVNSPTPNVVRNGTAPPFSVSVSNYDEVFYSFDGGTTNYSITIVGGTGASTFDAAAWNALPNGTVTVTFGVNDSSNIWVTADVTFLRDFWAPVVSVTLPATGFYKTVPTYSITVDEGNLHSRWYTLNGGTAIVITSNAGSIDGSAWNALADGSVTIRFYANDTAENSSFVIVVLTKDTTNPVISISAPTAGTKYTSAPTFTLSITEVNLASSYYTLNGSAAISFTGTSGTIDSTAWNSLADGDIVIRFVVTDSAGNSKYEEITVKKGPAEKTPDQKPTPTDPPAELPPWVIPVAVGAVAGGVVVSAVIVVKKRKIKAMRALPKL